MRPLLSLLPSTPTSHGCRDRLLLPPQELHGLRPGLCHPARRLPRGALLALAPAVAVDACRVPGGQASSLTASLHPPPMP